jgi:hypothetical protein
MRSCTIVGSKTVIEVARVIGIAARSDLANLPLPSARKRLTFMLAGFVTNRHFVYRVTNMENAEGVVSREAGEPFDIFTAIWPEAWVQRKTDLTIVGAELALDDTIGRRLGTFRKDSVRRPPAEVADMMVNLIRAAARHGKYGKYIGRNCMSIVVPREGSFTGAYHPDQARKTQHVPHLRAWHRFQGRPPDERRQRFSGNELRLDRRRGRVVATRDDSPSNPWAEWDNAPHACGCREGGTGSVPGTRVTTTGRAMQQETHHDDSADGQRPHRCRRP